MTQLHRIHHDLNNRNGDYIPWTLWTGEEYPSAEDIRTAAVKIQNTEVRDPFLQASDDYISVQKKRRIGWQTLEVINLFEAQK